MSRSQKKSKSNHFINNSNSDSSLDLTELQAQNSQLQMDNINKTAALSQISRENNQIKRKYEELLNALSNQQSNSTNTYSTPTPPITTVNSTHFFENMTQSFLPDERAEREVQLWTEMWTHLVSMITSIVPYSSSNPKTGNERRAILVDLVSKLCQRVNESSNNDYNTLKKKYQKSKEELKYLQEQQFKMTSEINKYKRLLDQKGNIESEKDEAVLTQKIKTLERLIHKLIEKQKHLQESSIRLSTKPSTISKLDQTPISQQQPQQQQQPPIQHQVIQFDDDSDEASSSNESEDYKNNFEIPNSSNINNCDKNKTNTRISYSFTKAKNTLSQVNNNKSNINNKDNRINTSITKNAINKRKNEQSISKKFGIDEISAISSDVEKKSKRIKKKIIKLTDEETDNDNNYSSDNDNTHIDSDKLNYRQLLSAEAEADEILAKSYNRRKKQNIRESNNYEYEHKTKTRRKTQQDESSIKSRKKNHKKKNRNKSEEGIEIRKTYGNHLNQLVNLTNHLTDDYHKLGKYLGNESNATELSIGHLSKLHDSLLSVEKKLDEISD